PKSRCMRILAVAGAMIAPVGASLAELGLLNGAEDIFFLTLPEARRAVAGEDLRGTVAERRATYRRELARRRIPRVLLSDGTDAETVRSEEHTSELQSRGHLVCRLLLEKKKK